MAALALVGLAVLTVAAWRLNTLALALVPVAAAYLILYPLTKRFTYLANPLLGWALAIAPAAAWIGVRGSLGWEPVVLSVAVAMWAGSFDIIYHAQDFEFHSASGLHSVAGRFGVRRAFAVARAMDLAASGALLALGLAMGLSWPFYLGWAAAVAGLSYKHVLVSPGDMCRIGMAFFRMNALVATAVLAGTFAAVFV
jgi:4-hydroxybenzoate polyprenyltransferase